LLAAAHFSTNPARPGGTGEDLRNSVPAQPPSKTLLLPFVGTCDDVSLTDLLVDEPTVSRALTVKPTFPVRRGHYYQNLDTWRKPSKRCVGAFEKPWVEPPSFPFPCRVGNMLQRKEAKNPSRDRRWGDPALYPKRREYSEPTMTLTSTLPSKMTVGATPVLCPVG
jgi:hypothetical protein